MGKYKYYCLVLLITIAIVCANSWSWANRSVPSSVLPATTLTTLVQNNVRANGEWTGRLILPSEAEIKQSNLADWVWIELANAPDRYQNSIGKKLRLTWQANASLINDIRQVTTDIKFTPATIASQKQGNIHAQRLNGRSGVGVLQSLAGARERDDVLVRLSGVKVSTDRSSSLPIIEIDREPMQLAGTDRSLVKIIDPDSRRAPACNAASNCVNEYFRVRHYNPNSQQFNGQIETVRIPQASATTAGLLPSTIRDLVRSPAGDRGWYIYGERRDLEILNVTALQPRSLVELTTQREITNTDEKLDYINHQHWADIGKNKGKLSKVNFIGHPPHQLQPGDRALVIHSFGGIGGTGGDIPTVWQTTTGHFAYGVATVVRSPFTGELEWSIAYNQVYAHNPNGIIAGKQDWATYMGNLERGWLGTRPVADALISYPPVTTDYDFGGVKLSPLTELQRQLQIFAARYRTGDGSGNASVTPATSCVQDANQALYITIRQLTNYVRSQPQIQTWLNTHPQDPQTLRFRELQTLGTELETTLAPLGSVREDWQQNAAKLAGIDTDRQFVSSSDPIVGLMSWKTMLPRGAQDGIVKIFSNRGANIWWLNTFQVGGNNPDIYPIAPTILFGGVPILATLLIRIWAGIVNLPSLSAWMQGLGLLGIYAAIALPIGFKSGFLNLAPSQNKIGHNLRSLIFLFFLPALVEEILFRVLLLPHPIETEITANIYFWSILSLILFIIYHPLNARTLYRAGNPTFMDWRFLLLAGCLGLICTIAYFTTGTIWTAVVIHWIVVSCWLKIFGGDLRLGK